MLIPGKNVFSSEFCRQISLCATFVIIYIQFRKLAGRTLFITGASRGIGKAIALKAAKDGANVVIAAKTATAHPKLPGTIYTAAEESKCFPYSNSTSVNFKTK